MKLSDEDKITLFDYCVLAIAVLALVAIAIIGTHGCTPVAHAVPPISSSHSQITATEYDLAEAAFSGGQLVPMPQDWADAECQRLLKKRNVARVFATGCGVATGGAGFGTLMPKDVTPEEKKAWDIALGGATLGFAVAGAVLDGLATAWTNEYETRCITETPAPPEHPTADEVEPTEADGGA